MSFLDKFKGKTNFLTPHHAQDLLGTPPPRPAPTPFAATSPLKPSPSLPDPISTQSPKRKPPSNPTEPAPPKTNPFYISNPFYLDEA